MIINSLLDLDFYKLLMAQVANDTFPATEVSYAFKNRTKKIVLKHFINKQELENELNHVRNLKVQQNEIDYLRSLNTFSNTFLTRLSNLRLTPITVDYSGDELQITTRGRWVEAILWETIVLSIVNELYYKSKGQNNEQVIADGKTQLYKKLAVLIQRPDIKFSDFGTRRRFSTEWQKFVVSRLKSELDPKSFLGTSNVHLAMELGLTPIGTQAHEYYMIGAGIFDNGTDESIIGSHSKMLDIWFRTFRTDKSIALSDTFGTDFFLGDFKKFAKEWKGLRHDSGDPFKFAEKVIEYYKSIGIDPKEKIIVFSDGLSVELMINLHDAFSNQIQVAFGIGTHLTNDMGNDWETLSIVMKADCVYKLKQMFWLVKLSDNLNKATGKEESVVRYKKVFGYINTQKENLVV